MSATASGLLQKVGAIFRRSTPSPSVEVGHVTKWIRPVLPPTTRWHTHQIQVGTSDQGRQLTDILTRRFNVTAPLVRYFIKRGKIQVSRAAKQPVVVQNNEDSKVVFESQNPPPPLNQIKTWMPRQNMRLEAGDLVVLTEVRLQPRPPGPPSYGAQLSIKDEQYRENLRNLILYRDEHLLILNKPPGLAMHAGPKVDRHLDALLETLREPGDSHAPLIIHRLDRDTSGALLLARDRETAAFLAARLRDTGLGDPAEGKEKVKKVYWAMVKGLVKEGQKGEIVSNIYKRKCAPGPGQERMTSMAIYRADLLDEGQPALTRYRCLQIHKKKIPGQGMLKLSLMELIPVTGRTHQLRVHMSEQLGLPIWGDYKYFNQQPPGLKMHLHCRRIELHDWPSRGQTLSVEAPLPDHFNETLTTIPMWTLTGKPIF